MATRLSRAWTRAKDRLLSPTVAWSFGQPGFRARSRLFEPGDLDVDLTGRTGLVTGANSGIGRATAEALAERGARVVMLCRNEGRGRAARDAIRSATGNDEVHLELLDVSSLASVRALAGRLGPEPIDVLVHNAGAMLHERAESAEGHEVTLAVHVLGPHLLTRLLSERLRAAEQARVIWVSSGGMYARRLRLDDLQWTRRGYDGVVAYAETKRAQVVLSELWAEVFADSAVTVNAMHPGWADTPAVREALPRFHRVTRRILRDPEQGADTAIWLALAPRLKGVSGHFWLDRQPRRTHYLPWTRASAEGRRELWDQVEAWTDPP